MIEKKTDIEQLKGILEQFAEEDVRGAIKEIGITTAKEWTDPFSFLGRGSPIFKAIFTGLEFPINKREDLISQAGGPSRLVIIPDSNGGESIYSLLDILEAFPETNDLFPMKTAKDLVINFALIERKRKKEHKTSPLLRIGGSHMKEIIDKRPIPILEKELMAQVPGLVEEPATSAVLLNTLSSDESLKMLKDMPESINQAMLNWIGLIVQTITDYHRDAALAAAANAETQANAAEAASTTAQNATQNVGAAATNQQAQQAVDQACAAASQAANAAQQAANAAASACAHAGSVPNIVEAQTACSNAQAASARATAAATRAQGDCNRARDIASISVVTICGHVNEEDPCCDDDVNGANIQACNVDYPEIPCATTTTDGNGNYCVTGRFGHSSRLGCANVRVTMNSGSGWGNISQTKQITVCSHSPANVNFSFDAPGVE